MSTPLRRAVERNSAPVVAYLRALPSWVPFVGTLLLLLGGLFAPAPIGVVLLVLIAALICWITYLAWPILTPGGRLGRLGALLLVLAAAAERAVNG